MPKKNEWEKSLDIKIEKIKKRGRSGWERITNEGDYLDASPSIGFLGRGEGGELKPPETGLYQKGSIRPRGQSSTSLQGLFIPTPILRCAKRDSQKVVKTLHLKRDLFFRTTSATHPKVDFS